MLEVQNSLQAYGIIRIHFNPCVEEVWVLALNSQLQLLGKEMIFRGTVDSCPIHPRDIFRYLIMKNATSFVLVHNHPSNSVEPSSEDIEITGKLRQLSDLIEITILDHLIIGLDKYYSFADFGMLKQIIDPSCLRHQRSASDLMEYELGLLKSL